MLLSLWANLCSLETRKYISMLENNEENNICLFLRQIHCMLMSVMHMYDGFLGIYGA